MKTLLVRPPRIKQAITLSDFMFSEPLGLEMIYGVIKDENPVEIFDMMIETISLTEKIKEYNPEVVGITSLCIDINMVIALSMETKAFNKDIITFVGGTQAYLNPEAFIDNSIDHIFEYTNKDNLIEFYNKLKSDLKEPIDGVLSKSFDYKTSGVKRRNQYLLPDRTSTRNYRDEYSYFGYKPAAIMEFGIGCEKCCNFCLRWRIEGRKEELLNIDLVKKDILNIKEPTIMFFDNDFFASKDKISTFIDLVRELELNKNYIVYGSVKGIIEHKEQIKILRDMGLKAVLVGYETFNEEEMLRYQKKSTIQDNYIAANILKELKIDAWASFMAHPDWSLDDFKTFRKYIKSLKPEISSISPLTPFPSLPMYKTYEERLIYKKTDYEKWSFGQVMIRPTNMSLRMYYYELLKTNLYVNLFINKKTEMLNQVGLNNIFRLLKGSLNVLNKYIILMVKQG